MWDKFAAILSIRVSHSLTPCRHEFPRSPIVNDLNQFLQTGKIQPDHPMQEVQHWVEYGLPKTLAYLSGPKTSHRKVSKEGRLCGGVNTIALPPGLATGPSNASTRGDTGL